MNPGNSTYAEAAASNTSAAAGDAPASTGPKKRKGHRGGKKRRNRRQSFAGPPPLDEGDMTNEPRPSLTNAGQSQARTNSSFYRLQSNNSNTSLESEALLDHRGQGPLQTRRGSVQTGNLFAPRPSQSSLYPRSPHGQTANPFGRSKLAHQEALTESEHEDDDADDRTPLMSSSYRDTRPGTGYGGTSAPSSSGRAERHRRGSNASSARLRQVLNQSYSGTHLHDYQDVNNPPSVPVSPVLGPKSAYDDVMLTEDLERSQSPEPLSRSRDALIDIENPSPKQYAESTPASPPAPGDLHRRMTGFLEPEDVCFPLEGMSEIGQEDEHHRPESGDLRRRRRRRWPDLGILSAWATEEKEQRTLEGLRTRKVSEPLMVGGRLRPQKRTWHREADDAPFRFTYFNEDFPSTIHSQTISELLQPGQTFKNLFIPDRPIIEDNSSGSETDDEDELQPLTRHTTSATHQTNGGSILGQRASSKLSAVKPDSSGEQTRSSTPKADQHSKPEAPEKPMKYGDRPAFWLDVLSPTDSEMKVLSKAFGIHPLTAEDIMMQEQREKVELFRHYYFINYRTFEQDESSEDYLEPVNLYVVVFREGVISFHFSMTPHPANVRRRIRQLQDYLVLSPDWISYGIIDDITDAYAPLIERIEEEVDEIDDAILTLGNEEDEHERGPRRGSSFYNSPQFEKTTESGNREVQESGRDMLRRVGECRKKVMGLYRLLGTKADVIKGFAKRCNEQWEVAPRSEIGLYLGDIQDHIVTMTGNLSHYENILSRAHSNYLAQINIRMNERQEKTSDILGKLTVLGTIVLPMNVVTGIWGMNCLVPGQDIESLTWFWCITGGLILFGVSSYLIAKRMFGIV
ncbi:cora-domain-containing protein [Amniculicola lignicola CBS 123094]|uniref:Cora-domain-containing protein n=1 Tax=Amniculicola lignicola CBS 123094 TaxID=1392246 RepID=A0A6A5WKK2_9PLEO|nr:cora-domain-containing protein [Amniculicola lignicola CBS 123094]